MYIVFIIKLLYIVIYNNSIAQVLASAHGLRKTFLSYLNK